MYCHNCYGSFDMETQAWHLKWKDEKMLANTMPKA